MAQPATDLVTTAAVKAFLNIPTATTTWDAFIESAIGIISADFSAVLGRNALAKTTYTAVYFDGNGEKDFYLPNAPVVSITSLVEDGTTLTEGLTADYVLYAAEGRLHRINGRWKEGPKTILITYAAGYTVQGATLGTGETALPEDLKFAAFQQLAIEWKHHQQQDWSEESRTFPDGSVSKKNDDIDPKVLRILRRHAVLGGA